MAFVKLNEAGVVQQKQGYWEEGFEEVPDDVVCGMLTDDGGKTFRNPPPPPLTVADFRDALYRHFDATAQKDEWDNRMTFMQRASFPGQYQQLALSFCAWIDACEIFALGLLAGVQAGATPAPENEEAFLALLPPFNP